MDGPTHYKLGEALIELAMQQYADSKIDDPNPIANLTMQAAQAHFAAAQVAATIDTTPDSDLSGWNRVLR